ncbi:hypothetical protein CLV24_11538 [Pontibacter ummariensis]|uniref:DUF4276 family protein n=2 Tax=Pontibacter ummariensis TaxID=1610492 RepID=A0A239HYP8_9BACT|nr:hypothetical protein CLV24_11538 [Pontibacter ummariensis]SNS86322.1 hypothetical protein SAMN06296052_11538 [Pontibacter ummariensis]
MCIVDGPTEIGALQSKFKKQYYDCPEIRKGPGNGLDFSIQGYTKGVLPTIKLALTSNIRAVILLPDLERRKETFRSFSDKLKASIIEALLECTKLSKDSLQDTIFVCPPDIMFENWIVCDIEGIRASKFINDDAIQDYYDGKNGASILDKLMNTQYKKTVHGPLLFKSIREEVGIAYSNSFNDFIECLRTLIAKHCSNTYAND